MKFPLQYKIDMVDLLAVSFLCIGSCLFVCGLLFDVRTLDVLFQLFIDEWTPGFIIDGSLLLVVNRIIKNNEKRNVLAQIGSLSKDCALDPVRRARDEGWLTDGTLKGRSLKKAVLNGVDLSGARLPQVNLRYADLTNACLTHCDLSGADLTGANLAGADLRWADLSGAQLKWAVLNKARGEGVRLTQTNLQFAEVDEDCAELVDCKGTVVGGLLKQEQVGILKDTFAELEQTDSAAINLFYENLFDARPELRPLFSDSQERQSRKLMHSLKVIITSLDEPKQSIALLEQLGARHAQYGVRPEHYELAGQVLQRTLADFFGQSFTTPIRESWQAAFALIASVMVQAADAAPNH